MGAGSQLRPLRTSGTRFGCVVDGHHRLSGSDSCTTKSQRQPARPSAPSRDWRSAPEELAPMDVPSLQRGRPRHKGREDGFERSMRNLSPSLSPLRLQAGRRVRLWSRPSGGQAGARQSLSRQRLKGIRRRRRAWALPPASTRACALACVRQKVCAPRPQRARTTRSQTFLLASHFSAGFYRKGLQASGCL